jgi:aminopeptidase N
MVRCVLIVLFSAFVASNSAMAQSNSSPNPPTMHGGAHRAYDILDSGGPMIPEQAAFDVGYYDIYVNILPDEQSIQGYVQMTATILHPTQWIVLDLDTTFTVSEVELLHTGSRTCLFNECRVGGQLWISLGRTYQPGEQVRIGTRYSGKPRVAPNPPWDGGFSWGRTPDGQPWIGVSCQTNGADLWWPVKDHNADRADSVSIRVRVPDPLFAASNGRFRGQQSLNDGTTIYHWFSSTPISNYNVTINVGPYTTIEDDYISTAGDTMRVTFWVLPEDTLRGQTLFPQFAEQLRFFEDLLGPYPFRADKYGVVQTSYLGMEHQTLIAYGAGFRNDRLFNMQAGYDDLHHHELAHEWWGNLVSVADWKDFWIHEGFATYMQALYTEQLKGPERYHAQMRLFRSFVTNDRPLAPRYSQSSRDMYRGRDIYYKGAFVLHTMRYMIGDEDFFKLLRRFAYPDPIMETWTDGSAQRFVSTDDFRWMTERMTGRSWEWFFDVYLHQEKLPELVYRQEGRDLIVEWITPGSLEFSMPVPVRINGDMHTIEVFPYRNPQQVGDSGMYIVSAGSIRLPRNATFEVDPEGWLLRK